MKVIEEVLVFISFFIWVGRRGVGRVKFNLAESYAEESVITGYCPAHYQQGVSFLFGSPVIIST